MTIYRDSDPSLDRLKVEWALCKFMKCWENFFLNIILLEQ